MDDNIFCFVLVEFQPAMANSFEEEDDGFKSGSEDELYLADKDWKKLQKRSLTEGFREGLDQATEDELQAGFDAAYVEAFQSGLEVGRIKGKIAAKMVLVQDSPEKVRRLELLEAEITALKSQELSIIKESLDKVSDEVDSI